MTEQANQTEATAIVANFDKTVDAQDFKFRFKKDKLGNQRAAVELKAFVPSVEGIISILEKGGKGLELLQDAVYDVIKGAIGADVSDNETFNQDFYNLNAAKYTWEAIANQPKEDRRSSAISTEQWEAFAADYINTMPGVTGKSLDAVTMATTVYVKKFLQVKTNKDVLKLLKTQLGLYMEHSKNAEAFSDILELLLKKADTYLNADAPTLSIENL